MERGEGSAFYEQEKLFQRRFIYRDNSKEGSPIIFETVANSISEADKEYQEATGDNPEKQPYVGCQVLPIESEQN